MGSTIRLGGPTNGNSRFNGAAVAALGSAAKGRKVSAPEVPKTPFEFGKVYLAEIKGELFQVLAVPNVPSRYATAVADNVSSALAREFRLLRAFVIYLSEIYCVSSEGDSIPLALVRPANGIALYSQLDLPHFAEHINALKSSAIERVFTSLSRKWHPVLLDQLDPPKAANLFKFIVFGFSGILRYIDVDAEATSPGVMKRVVRKVMPAMLGDEEWFLRFLGYATPAKLEEWLFRDLSVSRPEDAQVMQRFREALPRMTATHTVFSGLPFEEVKTALAGMGAASPG